MLKSVVLLLLISSLINSISVDQLSHCHCDDDDDGSWNLHILETQRVSDILIANAYFSIPLELLYFLSRSNVPFKWVLLQFIAFIVLYGLTHLINGWMCCRPHSFRSMMALMIAKLFTSLVSCATTITLLTLIPLLLKVKVSELFLKQNVLDLDQEVGIMKKQKKIGWYISDTLALHNCAVWMLNKKKTERSLTYELRSGFSGTRHSVPINDRDVLEITLTKGVTILRLDSVLAVESNGGLGE
ncbi:hypothetical protein L6452_15033 [Arctium lappa]|uniref:Uncharacterized protein n=1 Tax=Arctium lappa TaxID=4217 RepID=A0ACB9CMK5_ARCLA|nr:hypothetical protein L6452_15033 [Arctium lappa]